MIAPSHFKSLSSQLPRPAVPRSFARSVSRSLRPAHPRLRVLSCRACLSVRAPAAVVLPLHAAAAAAAAAAATAAAAAVAAAGVVVLRAGDFAEAPEAAAARTPSAARAARGGAGAAPPRPTSSARPASAAAVCCDAARLSLRAQPRAAPPPSRLLRAPPRADLRRGVACHRRELAVDLSAELAAPPTSRSRQRRPGRRSARASCFVAQASGWRRLRRKGPSSIARAVRAAQLAPRICLCSGGQRARRLVELDLRPTRSRQGRARRL